MVDVTECSVLLLCSKNQRRLTSIHDSKLSHQLGCIGCFTRGATQISPELDAPGKYYSQMYDHFYIPELHQCSTAVSIAASEFYGL